MATTEVCLPRRPPEIFTTGGLPVWSLSTKGLHCDDPFARLISPDFVDLVDPRKLIMFLPHDLLTPADEDRVVAWQENQGRQEAAKLLLALLCTRGDWIPRLQQGLRHKEIRLNHLADKIDDLQREVRMEIDFPDCPASDMLMEVDAEPWSHTSDAKAPPHSAQGTPLPADPPPTPQLSFHGYSDQGRPAQGQEAPAVPPEAFLPQGPPAVGLPTQAAPGPAAAPQAGFPELPQRLVSGRGVEEPSAPGAAQKPDLQSVLRDIAHHFFFHVAKSMEDEENQTMKMRFRPYDLTHTLVYRVRVCGCRKSHHVKILTEHFERITTAVTTGYAVGCLEMRLRLQSSRDLSQLRRLVESGVLQDMVERALLTEERCDWLRQEAAKYCLAWRQIKVKVTIAKDDLDRCENFLTLQEETANPRNAVEALLQKACVTKSAQIPALPDLLVSFLDWLLHRHPDLAQRMVPALVFIQALRLCLERIMDMAHRHFNVEDRFSVDLGHVAFDMLKNVSKEQAEQTFREAQSTRKNLECSSLCIEAPPGSPLAVVVNRLIAVKMMMPHEEPNTKHVFRFVDVFVADAALSCIHSYSPALPDDYVSKMLQNGSTFVMLHLLSRFRRHTRLVRASINHQLLQCMSDPIYPQALTDMYIAYYGLLRIPEHHDLFKRHWWIFGWQWKCCLQRMFKTSGQHSLPDILLGALSNEEMVAAREIGAEILSARHTVDLTDKLTNMSKPQLRVLLACAQLTNVGRFSLKKKDEFAAVTFEQDKDASTRKTPAAVQPALKLCKNRLEDRHVECLLDALPGLESVSHFDLSFCTITHASLQCILSHLSMHSVKTLVLNGISFSDSRHATLPKFSHLKKLQAIELSFLGLQDCDMPQLAQQICQFNDLRELTLEENPITTDGLSQLTPALASCASLRALRLPGCPLDAGAAFVLGAILTSAMSLHVLNLSRCRLMDSGLYHLSMVLRKHTALRKISLREGGYSPAGLASFFFYLRTCPKLQHLELGQCHLEEEGLDVSDQFLRVLAGSCHWDFLGLWRCRIGHTSFLQQLGTLSTQLRGLTSLVLQDNDLGDVHVGHLADAVRKGVFRHLRHLNLRQNTIGEAGAQQLADVLHFLPHLTELLMQHSAVPVDGAFSLARAILYLPDMTLLDLSDSYGMGRYEVIDAVTKIETLVNEEGIVIGSGVEYTDGDSVVEERSVAEQLRLLNLQDVLTGDKRGESKDEREGKKSFQPSFRVFKKPVQPEGVHGEGYFDPDTDEYVVVTAKRLEIARDLPGNVVVTAKHPPRPSGVTLPPRPSRHPQPPQGVSKYEDEVYYEIDESHGSQQRPVPPPPPSARPHDPYEALYEMSEETVYDDACEVRRPERPKQLPPLLPQELHAESEEFMSEIPIPPPPPPPLEVSEEDDDSPEVTEDVYEDFSPTTLISPRPEESAASMWEERRREISGRDRDTLFVDGVLRISLGHQ